jgi:hypothetical protein
VSVRGSTKRGLQKLVAQSLVFQRLCGSCVCNGAYNPLSSPACAAWDWKGRSQEAEVRSQERIRII